MAGRILNRRELRKQSDQAEQVEAALPGAAPAAASKARAKTKPTPAVRKPRKPKAIPRMRALWCIYDGGMKEVALFDYNQQAAAEERLTVLRGKQKGIYFLQIVKKPMVTAELAEAASPA